MNKNIAQLEDDYGVSPDSLAEASGSLLPPVGTNDKGKFLHTNESTGEKEWAEVSGLPAVTDADNGKVLSVVNGEWDKANAPIGLPSTTGVNRDDYLGISESGAVVWVKPLKLTASGDDLIMDDPSVIYVIQRDQVFYTEPYDTPYGSNRVWYKTVSFKYNLMGGVLELIIKNELTGQLYKNNGTGGAAFSPYTPSP